MKFDDAVLADLAAALARNCPPAVLSLIGLEHFDGPSPDADCPALVFTITTGSGKAKAEAIAAAIANDTGATLSRLFGVALASGATTDGTDAARGWIESPFRAATVRAFRLSLQEAGRKAAGRVVAAQGGAERAALERLGAQLRPVAESLALIAAARRRDIPFLRISRNNALWQFGWGRRSERFWGTASNRDGMTGRRIAGDRNVAKRLLRELGLPTPDWRFVGPRDDAAKAAAELGFPCLVKSAGGGSAKGETIVADPTALGEALARARTVHRAVIIEKQLPGEVHHLIVIDRKLAMATRGEAGAGEVEICEVSADVHPQVRELAEHVPAAFALNVADISYLTTDISRSPEETGGAIVDISITPAITATNAPDGIADAVLGDTPGRIPVTLLLAPPDAHEASEALVAPKLAMNGGAVGETWARIGPLVLPKVGRKGVDRVAAMLRHPGLDSLVIVWSAEQLAESGLPVDRIERAVLLGQPPSEPWLEMLRRRSNTVVTAASPAKAVSLSFGTAKSA